MKTRVTPVVILTQPTPWDVSINLLAVARTGCKFPISFSNHPILLRPAAKSQPAVGGVNGIAAGGHVQNNALHGRLPDGSRCPTREKNCVRSHGVE